ncbi:MAG TPA: hypothetical protein VFC03_17375 [Acidimicrobiales bacterium]|nr:hypothetical protein [Acidimicrobiales bacterium]
MPAVTGADRADRYELTSRTVDVPPAHEALGLFVADEQSHAAPYRHVVAGLVSEEREPGGVAFCRSTSCPDETGVWPKTQVNPRAPEHEQGGRRAT